MLTALHVAANAGVLDASRLLVADLSAEVNSCDENGRTPLFYAVVTKHFDVAEKLINCGADVEHCDREGMT